MLVALPRAAPPARADDPQSLRERLTEREDENRTEDPHTVEVFGNPLSLNAQYEISTEFTGRITQADPPSGETRALLANELEVEAFYPIGDRFSVFLQTAAAWEEDLLGSTLQGLSDSYVQRGEMWLRAPTDVVVALDPVLQGGRRPAGEFFGVLPDSRIFFQGLHTHAAPVLVRKYLRPRPRRDGSKPSADHPSPVRRGQRTPGVELRNRTARAAGCRDHRCERCDRRTPRAPSRL